jgi:CRP-like cAMP-binding protein
MRQDSAFYVNGAGHEVAWESKDNRFYVVRNGEMRIHAKEPSGDTNVIRYTDRLEEFGITTDEELAKWTDKGDEFFHWANNSWFEVWDSNDPDYYSEPYHELKDAIGQAEVLLAEYGDDNPVE